MNPNTQNIIFSPLLTGDAFTTVTQGLDGTQSPEGPFAIACDVHVIREGVDISPRIFLWEIEKGAVLRRQLGPAEPGLTRAFCLQGFALLDWHALISDIELILKNIFRGTATPGYTLALTPHGALLVARDQLSTKYFHGPEAVSIAFCPTGLTAHAELVATQGLARTAERLLSIQK